MGSSIDDFLKEEGIFEEAPARAIKEVFVWQLSEEAARHDNQHDLGNRR
jgi:hypothetical protein